MAGKAARLMNAIPYVRDGKEVTREEFDRTVRKGPRRQRRRQSKRAMPGFADAYRNPLESLGLGCSRRQVKEFNRIYAEHKIDAFHKPDGTCVIRSRTARNQLLKAREMKDNDAGYGDYAGK